MGGPGAAGEPTRAFRADPDAVYAFVGRFFESLAAAGVAHVVISPGSRSTPLAISAERCRGLRTWIELDERAAAFFALGIGKATGRPAVLVCTSGTAAANYLPAIIEAHHARVPLIALTADRPTELRDFGAGQTIEQSGLYGRHPRWSVEVPIAEAGAGALRYSEELAARAVEMAVGRPAGPVHLNWPLREPLAPTPRSFAAPNGEPVVSTPDARAARLRFSRAELVANPEDVERLVALAARCERGVVVCGPIDADARLAEALAGFSARAGWPLLADPASPLRSGPWLADAPVLDAGDLLARAPGFASRMRPEVVIRIGDPPVSKAQRLWLEAASPAEVWWLDEGGQWGEPSRQATRVVRGGAASLLEAATRKLPAPLVRSRVWCEAFVAAGARGRAALRTASAVGSANAAKTGGIGLSGLAVAEAVARSLPVTGQLFASNSMPIRLLDLAMANRLAPRRVLCNRGASGIDGVTSTALGVAAATGRPTLLFTGDLAFLHDLSGLLLARREAIALTIVVLDDDGGGIFSFLPVAEQAQSVAYERLFRTPHGVDLARAAALFELDYFPVSSPLELDEALAAALVRPRVSLIHARVDAVENLASFRAAIARACAAVDAVGGDAR